MKESSIKRVIVLVLIILIASTSMYTKSQASTVHSSMHFVTSSSYGGFVAVNMPNGEVLFWGKNRLLSSSTPAIVTGLPANTVKISSGLNHTMALTSSGTVWVVGGNHAGQLGLGDTNERNIWTQVPGITGAHDINAGQTTSFIIRNDGTLVAAGSTFANALGLTDPTNCKLTFTQIPEVSNAVKVYSGTTLSGVILGDGGVMLTGDGARSAFNSSSGIQVFTRVPGVSNAVELALHDGYLIRTSGNRVYVGGANNWGELGVGHGNVVTNMQLLPHTDIIGIHKNGSHSYMLTSEGKVLSAGSGSYGLGRVADESQRMVFDEITGMFGVKSITGNVDALHMMIDDGRIFSIGYGFNGILGDGSTTASRTPVEAHLSAPYKIQHYQQNVTGTGYTLEDTDNLRGRFQQTMAATPKTYTGFTQNTTHPSRIESGTNIDGTLTLRLYYDRNTYIVTYRDYDNSVLKTETVRYGGNATPPANPSRIGYTFTGWNTNSTNVVANRTIKAQFSANTNTPYKVEHYKENTADDEYTLFETTNHTGTTDTTVSAVAKVYANYTQNTTHPSRIASGTVLPDGTRVFKLYYSVDRHSVQYKDKDGGVVETQTIKHGNNSTLPDAPEIPGYDFNGWVEKP